MSLPKNSLCAELWTKNKYIWKKLWEKPENTILKPSKTLIFSSDSKNPIGVCAILSVVINFLSFSAVNRAFMMYSDVNFSALDSISFPVSNLRKKHTPKLVFSICHKFRMTFVLCRIKQDPRLAFPIRDVWCDRSLNK